MDAAACELLQPMAVEKMRWRFVSEAATKQRSQLVGIDSGGVALAEQPA